VDLEVTMEDMDNAAFSATLCNAIAIALRNRAVLGNPS